MTLRDPAPITGRLRGPSRLLLASVFCACLATPSFGAPDGRSSQPAGVAQGSQGSQPGTSAGGGPAGGGAAEAGSAERELERARESFLQGRALMEQERWPAAAAAFEQAAQVRPTPGLFYHVAYCRERSGQFLKARESYLAARELSQSQPAPDVDKLLPEALARVESELGRLVLTGAPPSAQFLVDGATVSPAGELWLEPGEHELHLTADGYEPRRFVLRLARGQTEKVDLSLQRSGTPPTAGSSPAGSDSRQHAPGAQAPETHSPLAREIVFWSGVSVGMAGTTLGVVGLVQMQDANSKVTTASEAIDDATLGQDGAGSHCQMPTQELTVLCAELADANVARESARNLAIVGFSLAAVGVTTAVLSRTLWKGKSTHVSVLGLPGGGVLHLSGRF